MAGRHRSDHVAAKIPDEPGPSTHSRHARHALRRQTDIADWDWDAEIFDVIVAIFIQFADPPLWARIFAGIQRALRPGGQLILQGYRPKQLEYRTGGSKK